ASPTTPSMCRYMALLSSKSLNGPRPQRSPTRPHRPPIPGRLAEGLRRPSPRPATVLPPPARSPPPPLRHGHPPRPSYTLGAPVSGQPRAGPATGQPPSATVGAAQVGRADVAPVPVGEQHPPCIGRARLVQGGPCATGTRPGGLLT